MARFKITNLRSFTALAPEPVSRKLPPYGSVEHDGPAYLMDNAQMKSAIEAGVIQVTALGDSASTMDSIETSTNGGGGDIRRGGLGVDYTKISTVETKYMPPLPTSAPYPDVELFSYSVGVGELVRAKVIISALSAGVYAVDNGYTEGAISQEYLLTAFRPTDPNALTNVAIPEISLVKIGADIIPDFGGFIAITPSTNAEGWSATITGGVTSNPQASNLLRIPPYTDITVVAGASISQGDSVVLTLNDDSVVTFVFDKNASVVETGVLKAVTISDVSTVTQVRDALIAAISAWAPGGVVPGAFNADTVRVVDTNAPVANEVGVSAVSTTLVTTATAAGDVEAGDAAGVVFVVEVAGLSAKHTVKTKRTDIEDYSLFFIF